MSASPRSISARRVRGEGMSRAMTRRSFGQLAAGPVVVADVDGLDAGLPAFDLEGAAAGDVVLEVVLGPGVAAAVLDRELAVEDEGYGDREVRQGQLVAAG